MFGIKARAPSASQRSFLPEDYLARRIERRTNFLALSLFSVVTVGVLGAFLVTNRQWHDVKHYQEAINVRYAQAAKDIEQLKQLEDQRAQLLQKAELTTTLIERVPRSILLAELTNRMPLDVTLLELELKSARLPDPPAPAPAPGDKAAAPKGKAARTAQGDKAEVRPASAPPRFETKLAIIGVTNTHNSVAQYVAKLQQCGLLTSVELKFSEKSMIEEREMNRFRIEASLRIDADARRIDPIATPRINDAFEMEAELAPETASASEGGEP